MGLFPNGNHFYENSFVSTYQRITFLYKTVIVTMLLSQRSSIKIQGPKWTKENFKDFQGLEKGLLKFKGFQDAYEPWLRDKTFAR